MNNTFEFDKLPDKASNNSLEEGIHTLTIKNLEQVISKTTGSLMYQFSYIIDGNENLKLNFDNCPLRDRDGNPINFGGNKLKKIITATGTVVSAFSAATLKPLLLGKSFNVKLTKNEKGYLVIAAENLDTITPVSSAPKQEQPVQQTRTLGEQEVRIDLDEEDIVDVTNGNDFNW